MVVGGKKQAVEMDFLLLGGVHQPAGNTERGRITGFAEPLGCSLSPVSESGSRTLRLQLMVGGQGAGGITRQKNMWREKRPETVSQETQVQVKRPQRQGLSRWRGPRNHFVLRLMGYGGEDGFLSCPPKETAFSQEQ